jgi:hypothetical protein
MRHGAEGYAIYFHCLELIASDLSETNIKFCLEHDSEIIADNLKIKGTADKSGIEVVEDIMHTIVDLKLLDQVDNRIFCFKMLKRLDTSMTSSKKMRDLITDAKKSHDRVMIESCAGHDAVMQEEKRREKKTKEKKEQSRSDQPDTKLVKITQAQYSRLADEYDKSWLDWIIKKMDNWCVKNQKTYEDYHEGLLGWIAREKDKPQGKQKSWADDRNDTSLDLSTYKPVNAAPWEQDNDNE